MRFVLREYFQEVGHVLCGDIQVGDSLSGVDIEADRAIECSFVVVVPRA